MSKLLVDYFFTLALGLFVLGLAVKAGTMLIGLGVIVLICIATVWMLVQLTRDDIP